MLIKSIVQPEDQLGRELDSLLDPVIRYSRITFVSAWVALRTILRLRDRLLTYVKAGTKLSFTIGFDLQGTSRDVLEELQRWKCDVFLFHNAIARSTFHPKIYLFESETNATLFVGSNNLTDGGLYTNYEAATRHDFSLPSDLEAFKRTITPFDVFLNPKGDVTRPLDKALIQTLTSRGELLSESESRQRRTDRARENLIVRTKIPASPFAAIVIPLPPLLTRDLRVQEPKERSSTKRRKRSALITGPRSKGALVWQKQLPQSDALEVKEGSNPVGGVRLTQAKFLGPDGQRIDQTTYFRNLFADYEWEPETAKHRDQEHTFVPMRVFLRGKDQGVHNFEISHKPSGEAGQDNYTTMFRWGREFSPVVRRAKLGGSIFSLYETGREDAAFLIDITDQ